MLLDASRLAHVITRWWRWGHIKLFHISILYIIFYCHYSIVKQLSDLYDADAQAHLVFSEKADHSGRGV
jgi:hypothetical protein